MFGVILVNVYVLILNFMGLWFVDFLKFISWTRFRRFILDGYPVTMRQVELMTERCIIPVRVIELTVDSMEVVTRATADRYSPDRYDCGNFPSCIVTLLPLYLLSVKMYTARPKPPVPLRK